jgi:fatty-acyl-CoA synthase
MDDLIYANIWELIARIQPERPAIIQGDDVRSWAEFDRRSDALAADFLASGLGQNAKVGAYLYNGPEFLEAYFAAMKAGMHPFNVNYRYAADELSYLFDNADAEAVVFHSSFSETLEAIRERLPRVKRWIAVRDGAHPIPAWAADYASIVAETPSERPVTAPWGRSGDDIVFLYTGGTTGMPKGVMWRQADLFPALGGGANPLLGLEPFASLEDVRRRIADPVYIPPRGLTASPLMHGTGGFGSMSTLSIGGAVLLLPSRRFSAEELCTEVERLKATRIGIVGQAFAGPILETLDAHPGRWDLSSVRLIGSSGCMWSQENKQGLLRHMPDAALIDSFSSSEAIGMGASESRQGEAARTARFAVSETCAVFTEDGRRVQPGSGERGMTAVSGYLPIGYYKDAEKTAKTFPVFEGRRWCAPGDWALVNADGTLEVLGRGSVCINTGGEKVFPEEVEEALKRHVSVRDAVVVGLPDPRFGERICAVVELVPGAEEPTLGDLAAHVKGCLADYKAPRNLVLVESVGRAPNGKVDYKATKARAAAELGIDA